MKTITLFTLGTETDAQYMLALGDRLQQQGHAVRLAAASEFQPLARKLGLSFQPLDVAREIRNQKSEIKNFTRLQRGGQKSPPLLQQIQQLAENSSLMVVHKPYLPLVQMLTPLPCPAMGVALQAEEAFSRFGQKRGLLRRLISWIKSNGSKSIQPHIPTLYNFSPQLLAGQPASHPHLTGQWAIPDSLLWQLSGRAPSPGLSDWLYRGGRPVFFDFSQAPEAEREPLLKMVNELSRKMGFRAILCTSWANCEEGALQRDVFHVKSPVQEWLFQQCAAVVHYRQSNKLPEAIRAGIPSILCASDAAAGSWGQILRHHGIGIHLRKEPPTAASLEAALEEALRLTMQYKAKAMGKALREEDGLEYAAKAIGRQVEQVLVAVAV